MIFAKQHNLYKLHYCNTFILFQNTSGFDFDTFIFLLFINIKLKLMIYNIYFLKITGRWHMGFNQKKFNIDKRIFILDLNKIFCFETSDWIN